MADGSIEEHLDLDATSVMPFNVVRDPELQREAIARTEHPSAKLAPPVRSLSTAPLWLNA